MNLFRKSTWNVSIVLTFFKILNSWKVLSEFRWMFDEIVEEKVCIK